MTAALSDVLVLFGVTGDLAHKMIFPALYSMAERGALKVPIIGVAFPKWSLAQLSNRVKDSIRRSGGIHNQRALADRQQPDLGKLLLPAGADGGNPSH